MQSGALEFGQLWEGSLWGEALYGEQQKVQGSVGETLLVLTALLL